ncbi:UvrD-helicase domain-containing protein [Nesterenkonia massiliensis]|uniref:UvrD-helicase domain-containing protein n=1 Tax=Nesterenkonia massiliensis TaxID=1232429 RepID=UPI0004273B55|nr:UvrD-helicase domain-containing protein [Nesterenkonia massiliensis]
MSNSPQHQEPALGVEWDAYQRRVLELLNDDVGPTLVYGTPGSGKTALTVRLAVDFITAGNDASRLLILSPSRSAAATLRSRIERALASAAAEHGHFTAQPSRSFSAFAFWILNQAREFGVPGAPLSPRLLAGAEQDKVIGEELQKFADQAEDENSPWHRLQGAFEAPKSLRKQIRDFFDRCREYQVSAAELKAHSPSGPLAGVNRPEWHALGELLGAYSSRLENDMPGVYDPSALVAEAEQMLTGRTADGNGPRLDDVLRSRLDLILVDDIQEATPGVFRLLRALGMGQKVIAFGNPDAAVQGFRGARPDKLANWTVTPRDATSPDMTGSMAAELASGSASVPGRQPQVLSLPSSYRLCGETLAFYFRTVERIGAVATLLRRPQGLPEPETTEADVAQAVPADTPQRTSSVSSEVLSSHHLADQFILQQVLQARFEGVPWGRIAVVVRNGERITRLGRLFAAHGVQVQRSVSELVLHEEDAVWPLLRIMEHAAAAAHAAESAESPSGGHVPAPRAQTSAAGTSPQLLQLPDILDLLGSVYTGADAQQIRTIRQLLISAYRGHSATENLELPMPADADPAVPYSTSDLLLIHAVRDHPLLEQVLGALNQRGGAESEILRPLLVLRQMVRAATAAQADPQRSSAESVLWAAWDASAVAEAWQEAALSAGTGSDRAHRHLDAVMGLFQVARRFLGTESGSDAAEFVDYVEELDLPMDGLVDTGTAEGGVEILTPAAAAGQEFHTVILSDLQDGEWPKVRPQGELLGASDLIAVKEAGAGQPLLDLMAKRQESLMDEYRVFASAASRASDRLVLVAVQGDGEVPSSLYNLHHPATQQGPGGKTLKRQPVHQIPRLIQDRALVAELRTTLETQLRREQPQQELVAAAAAQLAELAAAGVPGAHPEQWWGAAALSSTDPILAEDAPLSISPSAVGTAQEQPLQWFTSQAGGDRPRPFATELGTFIHDELHEPHPDAEEDVLLAVLEEKWPEFVTTRTWSSEREKAEAVELVRCLGRYYQSLQSRKRRRWVEELHLRQEFDLDLNDYLPPGSPVPARRKAVVSGMADRIELPASKDAPQGLYVVDLKTTKNPPKDEDVWDEYPQIGVYQLMIASGAVSEAIARRNERITEQLNEPSLTEAERTALQRKIIDPAQVEGETLDLAASAGAALLQLRRTKTRARAKDPVQPQEALRPPQGAGPDWWQHSWPMNHLRRAAAKMLHPQYEATHAPGTGIGSSCYVGPLCPLCEDNSSPVQRQWRREP